MLYPHSPVVNDNDSTYLRVIDTHHDHGVGGDLFNGIEIPHGIHVIDGPVHFPPGARPPQVSVLQLLNALLPPLAQEALLIVLAGRAVRRRRVMQEVRIIRDGLGSAAAMAGTEEGLAKGALAGAFKGLGVGDDALRAGVGVEDGVGDMTGGGGAGTHGGGIFGVGELGVIAVVVVVVRPVQVVVTIFGMRGGFLAVVLHEAIELVLSGRHDGGGKRRKGKAGEKESSAARKEMGYGFKRQRR